MKFLAARENAVGTIDHVNTVVEMVTTDHVKSTAAELQDMRTTDTEEEEMKVAEMITVATITDEMTIVEVMILVETIIVVKLAVADLPELDIKVI